MTRRDVLSVAARMYDIRCALRAGLGERYDAIIEPYRAQIRAAGARYFETTTAALRDLRDQPQVVIALTAALCDVCDEHDRARAATTSPTA